MRLARALVLSSLIAACSDDVGLPDARTPIDAAAPGQISLTWTLSHAGAPQTCASVGATSISADVVPVGAAFGEALARRVKQIGGNGVLIHRAGQNRVRHEIHAIKPVLRGQMLRGHIRTDGDGIGAGDRDALKADADFLEHRISQHIAMTCRTLNAIAKSR